MKYRLTLLCFLIASAVMGQVITPFSIRYQTTQKGGIRYVSNTSVSCNGGGGCAAGRAEVPPAGTGTDNGFTAAYVDIDSDGSTFSSSADSLNLPMCSQISWAGLYWGGEITNAAANYATRNQVRIKTNNGTYVNLTADQLQDNAVGFDTYHCYKDVTSIVQAAGTNARFTVANVACRVGGTNRFAGWTIVVVYKNDLQPMRNLTVFNGLSNVSGGNPITDISVSGFLTPLSGPVTFEVGNVTYDGDRSSTGDQLMFNGGSGFVNISDAVNPLNDIFNSTMSYNGVQKTTPFINPAYTNTLGYDADIFIPNNAAKNYIGNSATSATLRLTTGGETFLTQVVTMAIDVYEPDLRAACRVVDLNGGSVNPGDILEYTVVGKNIGSDPSVNTFITDTLEYNAVYVPGSLSIIHGPNLGVKTDAAGDDQAEYIAANRTIRVRAGTGANAVSGGQMNNSALGVDSTVFRFRAMATTDCIVLQCDNIINNRAYIFGTGNVSGNTWSNGSNPNIFDGNGCPVPGTTNTPISAASCVAPAAGSNSPVCTGSTLSLTTSPSSTVATYSWTGPGGFVSSAANPNRANATVAMAGTYTCVISVPSSSCSYTVTTTVAVNVRPATPAPGSNTPVCTGNTISLNTAAVAGATYSWTGPSAFASALQNPTRPNATAAMSGTYSVTVTANGCTSAVGTTAVVVNTTPATPAPLSNSPVCTGNTISLSTSAVAGATYSWTGPNSFASALQNPTITNATAAMAGTYSVTVTTNGCTSGVGTVAVVVNNTPATPAPSSNTPVCTGNTINLSTPAVAGATYSWTGPNSFASALQNPTITNATTAMAGTYSVAVTANGCTSAAGTTAVVVNSTPATPAPSSNTPVCTGNTINLSTAAVAGATYSWTGPNSFASALQNPTITNATTAMAGTYSVTVTANGCTSGVGTTAVVVNSTPATPAPSSNTPVCTGNTINLSTPAVAGATYSWTGPNSFASSVQNPSITNATTAMAGTYSVTVTTNGCTSGVGTTAVVINTTPATPAPLSNTPVCTGNTISLSTAAVAGATYSWTGPNSFVSAVQNPSITNATTAMAGTYSVTVTANGCTSAAGTTAVVVNSTPATPAPSSNTPVCTGNTISLSTPAVAGATYSWTGPSAFSSSLQNPTRTNATIAMAGTYSVTVTANGCTSGVGTTAVVVNSTPATPTASSNTPVCSGNTISLSTPAVAGATYSWTGPNSFASSVQNPSLTNATTAMGGTYSVTVTANGCTSAMGTTAVVVNSTPATPAPSSNTPVCTGNTINLSTAAVAGATYSWTGPNSFASSVQNPSLTNATVAMSGTYSVTVTANGCTSAIGTVAVTVNPTPGAPVASSNSPVCTGNTINLSTPAVVGATYSWTGPNSFSSSAQNPSITNATPAMAGTYTVIVNNGCNSAPGTVSVVINATPATPTAAGNSPVCSGNTINLTTPAVAGATYSWTGPNSFTSSVQNPSITNATVAMSGTYSVAVTENGCTSAMGTVAVTVNATPATPVVNSNSPVCTGNALNLSTAAVAGATYSWSGPNSFSSSVQNPTVASTTLADAGTYSLTVTVNGCSSTEATSAVIINTTPAALIAGSNSPVCTGDALNLTSSVATGTYNWSGPNGFTAIAQNPTISPATLADAGTFTVTITENGCTSAPSTVAVVVNATPVAPTIGSNTPVCTGDAINFTASATTGSYNWNGPNSFTSSVQNPTITPATLADGGTFTLTVTENGCTSAMATTAVVVNATPAAPVAGANSPVCENDSILLMSSVTTGTYSWSGPNGFTSAVQNPFVTPATLADAGTYSVTVTETGCTSPAGTVAVVVNATPVTPVANSNSPVCEGDSILLNSTSTSGSYSWSGPNGFTSAVQNPFVAPSTLADAGTYNVVVIENGCTSDTATVTVTVNALPATPSPLSNSPVCSGDSILLTVSPVVGATYAWSGPNGFTSAAQDTFITAASALNDGTYTLTLTMNGCTSAEGTVNVTVVPTPSAPQISGVTPVCEGSPINFNTPFVTGATWSWTGPNAFASSAQNPTITPATLADAGTYSLTITENGCTSSEATFALSVTPLPASPVANSNSPVCEGDSILLSASAATGTYAWSGPNGFTSADQNPSVAVATLADAGNYIVTLTENGCTSAPDTVVVSVTAAPATPVVNGTSVCEGDSILLTSNATTGTYSWMGPNGFASTVQNPIITPSSSADAGTYSLIITENGCSSAAATVSVAVSTMPATPVANANSPVCEGDSILFTTASAIGTYNWTGPNGFASSLQNPFIAPAALTDAGTYSVTIIDNGCSSLAASVNVVVNAAPATPTAISNSPICAGDSLLLSVAPVSGATYAWSGPNGFTSVAQDTFVTPATTANSGIYSLVVTVNGCSSAAGTVNATVNPIPSAPQITAPATVCEGSPVNFTTPTVAGATWSWTGPDAFASSLQNPSILIATLNSAGTYSLNITENGCTSADATFVLNVNAVPAAPVATALPSVCAGQSIELYADTIAGVTYTWFGPDGFTSALQNPTITNATTGMSGYYTVSVSVNGCTSIEDTVSIIVDACNDDSLIIPSGFSPNGDGINDYFEVVGITSYPDNKVTIFNRWGNLVYEAAGYNNGSVRWEGNNSGELSTGNGAVPEATYFYVIDLGDGSPIRSGYIYLNRQ